MNPLIKVKLFYCVVYNHDGNYETCLLKSEKELDKKKKYEEQDGFNKIVASGYKQFEIDHYGNIQSKLDFIMMDENDNPIFSI